MKVYIDRTNETKKIKFKGTVEGLLKRLHINPETVIIARDEEMLTEKDKVNEKDFIKILSVVSGG